VPTLAFRPVAGAPGHRRGPGSSGLAAMSAGRVDLLCRSSRHLWKYFGWNSVVHSSLSDVIKSLPGIIPFISIDPCLSQDLYEQINAYVFTTV
jgi:hypothetical protein